MSTNHHRIFFVFFFVFFFFQINEILDTPTLLEMNSRRFQYFTDAFCLTQHSGVLETSKKTKRILDKEMKWQPAQIH